MKINLLLISAIALISWSLQLQITITYGLQVVNEHDPHHHQCHRFDQFEFTINNYNIQLFMAYKL